MSDQQTTQSTAPDPFSFLDTLNDNSAFASPPQNTEDPRIMAPVNDPEPKPEEETVAETPTQPQETQSSASQNGRDPRIEQLEQQLRVYEQLVPIAQVINNDPVLNAEVMTLVQQKISGTTAQPKTQPAPVAPDQPAEWDEILAYTDPSSSSWKYRKSMEKYKDDLHQHELNQLRQVAKASQDEVQYMKEQQQTQAQLSHFEKQVVQKYGADAERAQKFTQWITNPEYTVEDLWAVFNARNGNAAPQTESNQGTVAKPTPQPSVQPQRNQFPLPSSTGGGDSSQTISPSDVVFNAVLNAIPSQAAFN